MVQAAKPMPVHWFFSAASTWRPRFPRDGWSATPFPSTVIQYTQGLGVPQKIRSRPRRTNIPKKSSQKRERLFRIRCRSGRWPVSNSSSAVVDEMRTKTSWRANIPPTQ